MTWPYGLRILELGISVFVTSKRDIQNEITCFMGTSYMTGKGDFSEIQ
jgi:hypothetical protein